jgi:hypothetical protein
VSGHLVLGSQPRLQLLQLLQLSGGGGLQGGQRGLAVLPPPRLLLPRRRHS